MKSLPLLKVSLGLLFFVFLSTAFRASASHPTDHGSDWPLHSYDYSNSNYNSLEHKIRPRNVKHLRRAWETFNDDTLVGEDPPTGFVLETVLGLGFPNAVVGVIASPLIKDGTIYYVDALGTVFARDAKTGMIANAQDHWTTTLVDPDYDNAEVKVLPELIYTAPMLTDEYVWIVGSVFGRLHAIARDGGAELDFDPSTAEIDPFALVDDFPFSSILGDSVIVEQEGRTVLITSINVILNDALVGGGATGLQVAFDITDAPNVTLLWRQFTVPIDPETGEPFNSGVSAGAALAWDPELAYLFGGTGQNTSVPYEGYPDPDLAPNGYIDRSDSLYEIDFLTGETVWSNQFHTGDVFNLNDPVSTGPNQPDGPRDADVLSPPILFSANIDGNLRYLAGNGSKGGLYRVVDRDTGETVWDRKISKATGIGGIQAGAAVAHGVVYVAGFEGIDDGFSDAQFGVSFDTGLYGNAFFATFSPAFWADVEDVSDDDNPATGMRIKVYALDAATGESLWNFEGGQDYVELLSGSALRHVSVANRLVYITTSAGELLALRARDGKVMFRDQTLDLNEHFDLGLGKAHHASMNGGSLIADGMVYVPYGGQNNPSGGVIAYEINRKPIARKDRFSIKGKKKHRLDPLANDSDPNGDKIRFTKVGGHMIDTTDNFPDTIDLPFGWLRVFNPGDNSAHPEQAYIEFKPNRRFRRSQRISYTIEDLAPSLVVNGETLETPNPTHRPRKSNTWIKLVRGNSY